MKEKKSNMENAQWSKIKQRNGNFKIVHVASEKVFFEDIKAFVIDVTLFKLNKMKMQWDGKTWNGNTDMKKFASPVMNWTLR